MNPVYEGPRRGTGTPLDPIHISYEEYQQIKLWLGPKEAEVNSAPPDEQEALIQHYRSEALKLWPWWFPNCHVRIG